MRTARLAKNAGVRRFVFASSCSVYGSGEGSSLTEESTPRPISLYARTKLMAENDLLSLADGNFSVTILRNGTVYGLSRRMRFDLIVNLMALCAFKYKKIRVMGGGRQWRPNVHLSDVIAAFVKIIEADDKKINGQILNVGSSEQNYKVVDIAYMVNNFFPEAEIEYVFSDLDRRNYNVNFDKIKRILGYSVTKTVGDGIQEIKEALLNGFVSDSTMTRTLDYYKHFIEVNKVL
jgi:nucleoside-diphosphate-sugar epimerase